MYVRNRDFDFLQDIQNSVSPPLRQVLPLRKFLCSDRLADKLVERLPYLYPVAYFIPVLELPSPDFRPLGIIAQAEYRIYVIFVAEFFQVFRNFPVKAAYREDFHGRNRTGMFIILFRALVLAGL